VRDRLAILEAMSIVIERREDLMRLVGSANDADAPRHQVMAHFGFNEVQGLAVLDLQVRRFADQERRRIVEDANQLRRQLGEPEGT
jgi:DNA gyrase/topoisomerase IV subunit A